MGARTTAQKQISGPQPASEESRFHRPARPFPVSARSAEPDLGAQIDRAQRFGHSLERLPASPVVQRMKVDDSDVGKRFNVRTTAGDEIEAELKEIRGGGWYAFEDGGDDYKVRGSDNILSRADKPMDALSRLRRAQDRAEHRHPTLPDLGKKVEAPTPFGMTGLSRQRYSATDPQTTTTAKDFGGATDPGVAYSDWGANIGGQDKWQEMMDVVDDRGSSPPPSFTDDQNRSAAMLFGTTHFSEPYRFKAAPKPARSAMRSVARGDHPPSAFSDLFPMAKPGGAHFYSDVLSGTKTLSTDEKKVVEEMSDSSDESDTDWWR